MDEQYVHSAIAKAAALINDERFNALVESKANRTSKMAKKNKGMIGGNSGGGSDLSAFEAAAGFGGGSSRKRVDDLMPSVDPEVIKESFRKTPAMSGGMGMTNVPSSYLETKQKELLQEQQYIQQPQYQPQAIDYNYLKYLINECIKENLNQLNESANLSCLKMAGGNKIQFVDSKGNVYEGILRRVK